MKYPKNIAFSVQRFCDYLAFTHFLNISFDGEKIYLKKKTTARYIYNYSYALSNKAAIISGKCLHSKQGTFIEEMSSVLKTFHYLN